MTERSCNTVETDCLAPPGWGYATATSLCTCWGCGDDVCKACSSVIAYKWHGQLRMVRMCFSCQDDRKVGRGA